MTPFKPHPTDSTASLIPAPGDVASPEAAASNVRLLRLVPPPGELPAGPPGDRAAEDRDVLLSAIKATLRASVEEPAAPMTEAKRSAMAVRVRASVLECVAALDRLHLVLTADAVRDRQRKLDAFDALAAPAQQQAASDGGRNDGMRGRQPGAPDPLALLPNRSSLVRRLRQAFAQARLQPQAFAVLTLDLEGFRPIQEAMGTDAGDELLGVVASRLVRAVRGHDMVCRLRGDEFGLFIASGASREQLRRLACKLFDAVAAPMAIGKVRVSVRPNIGIATGLVDGASGAALIKNARVALGHAGRQQMGYAFFDERGRPWVPGRI